MRLRESGTSLEIPRRHLETHQPHGPSHAYHLVPIIEHAQHLEMRLDLAIVELAFDDLVLTIIPRGAHVRPLKGDAAVALEPQLGVLARQLAAARAGCGGTSRG